MSEFFFSYGLFIAKIITALIALVFAVAIIGGSRKKLDGPTLKITNLNDKFNDLKTSVQHSLMNKKEYKALQKSVAKDSKKEQKSAKTKPKLFVLDFKGDIHASGVEAMRDEITALLSVAEPQDEVLMRLENAGGAVHEHGLASSQLQRITDAKLNFTMSVDRVAASGGYMMACVADKIVAAPFAILGSIGVLAQLPNFHRLLDRVGVDWEQHTAGEYKRTVTMFGENGEKEREKLKVELHETHVLFRDFVAEQRPKLDVDKVSTGEHWYGKQALDLNLVDELVTSDEYIVNALDQFDIYEISMEIKQGLQDKLLGGLFSSLSKVKDGLASSKNNSKFQ